MTENREQGSLYRILDLGILFLFGFIITLRLFNPGQDLNSLYTAFAESCIWLVGFLFVVRKLAAQDFSFRLPAGFLFAGLFVASLLVSVYTASQRADGFHASLLARHWIFEFVFYLLVFNFCISRERCNALLTVFVSTLVMICVFGIYQCLYGIEYFTNVVNSTPGLVANIVGENSVHQSLFMARVRSVRIYGPYGYPNTLAGILLTVLPFLCFFTFYKNEKSTKLSAAVRYVVLFLGFAVLMLSGSKAGIAAAKVGELLIFLGLKYYGDKFRGRSYLQVFSVFILSTSAAVSAAVILKLLLNYAAVPARVPVLMAFG
ncbi:MAG: hypothetical protein ACYTFY_08115, partial [Planctomycetota bacterium]